MDTNLKSRLALEFDRSLNRPPAGGRPLEDGISISSVNDRAQNFTAPCPAADSSRGDAT